MWGCVHSAAAGWVAHREDGVGLEAGPLAARCLGHYHILVEGVGLLLSTNDCQPRGLAPKLHQRQGRTGAVGGGVGDATRRGHSL